MSGILREVARLAVHYATLRLMPDRLFLPLYLNRTIDGQALLEHLIDKACSRRLGLRFKPYSGPVERDLIGVVNLCIVNDRLCFLLVEREASDSILENRYAFAAGRYDKPELTVEDVRELGDLSLRGLVQPVEMRTSGESVLHAAVRRNRDKTGIDVMHDSIIGRIEFQGTQPGVRIVLFIADVSNRNRASFKPKPNVNIPQWVPIDTLFSGNPGESTQAYLGRRVSGAKLMPSLMSSGLQELRTWIEEHI